jgi:hypothetical protein
MEAQSRDIEPKDPNTMKSLTATAALVLLSTATLAAEPAKDKDACLKTAVDLAEKAEKSGLADDKLVKIEEMLTKLEDHCEASRFAEAATVSTDIETTIGGK